MRRLKGWQTRIGGTALLVVALDWATQFWVSHTLVLGHQIWTGAPLQIHYMENGRPDPAWTVPLLLVAATVVLVVFRPFLSHVPWWVLVASGAAVGGALGNALEVIVVGHVVDFIQTPLPILGVCVGNLADAFTFSGVAVAAGGGLAVAAIHCLPETLPGWTRHAASTVLVGIIPLSLLLANFWLYGAIGCGNSCKPWSPPAITATSSSVPQITALASASGSRTLAIRAGHVEWLSLDPMRWTPVSLATRFPFPLNGAMQPTAVALTSRGVGLVGTSTGVVLAIAPGADHPAAGFADTAWGRVVALAGMGTSGHLEMLIATTAGTYSYGVPSPLAVVWPHKEATAVVAPANGQGTWAAVVGGHLMWASAAAATAAGGLEWDPGTWSRFKRASSTTWTEVWHPGFWSWVNEPVGSAWTQAAGFALGHHPLITERPGGQVAVATRKGAVLAGSPGEGLHTQLHTVANSPLGAAAKPTGLVATSFPTPGNVLVLAAAGAPLLVDGWSGWESLGGPTTTVHLVADAGGSVVEALAGGGVKVVAVPPTVGFMPSSGRSVPWWVGPAFGLAVLLALLTLAGFAAWRLPWRPRVAVFAAAGVLVFGAGGVAVGRFVIPSAARYTRSQVQEAWVNGVDAAGIGSWLLTPPQCGWLARAVGWHGPLPNEVTTAGEPSYGQLPNEVVPSCAVWAQQSPAQDHAAMRHPLSVDLNQDSTTYYLQIDLGPVATAATQAAAQSACTRLGSACEPLGQNGHFVAYYAVRVALPHSFYSLWQKVMGGAA